MVVKALMAILAVDPGAEPLLSFVRPPLSFYLFLIVTVFAICFSPKPQSVCSIDTCEHRVRSPA
jgi:hypothetical protein